MALQFRICPLQPNRSLLTWQQEGELREDVASIEEKLHSIARLMRVCHGEDSRLAVRADEILCALQRFNWELERVQQTTSAATG